jgi:hypothetical protein
MSTQITLTLPDETYRRAVHLAQLTGRDIADVLADTIGISLQPLGTGFATSKPVSQLTDPEVLAVADSHMEPIQDRRMSELLDRQQAGSLTNGEHAELLVLMQVYQEGLLRKAQALHEAVRRGLRKPLDS